ncbi:MAG: hypothetical protein ACP5D7_18745, partial [Limnospira sp.]
MIQTCEFDAYQIPKGWSVFYQIGRTHFDETVYPQPLSQFWERGVHSPVPPRI